MRIGLSAWRSAGAAAVVLAAATAVAAAQEVSDGAVGARFLLEQPALTDRWLDNRQSVRAGANFPIEWSRFYQDDDVAGWQHLDRLLHLDVAQVGLCDAFSGAGLQPRDGTPASRPTLGRLAPTPVGKKIWTLVVLELMAKGAKPRGL